MLGDGEIQEGQIWEAAFIAARYELDNLIAIVDHNALPQYSWPAAVARRKVLRQPEIARALGSLRLARPPYRRARHRGHPVHARRSPRRVTVAPR